ncbi:MAG: hypothetical protein M2R45_02086 [Verrucomicrobia subdivision 3 bacterium]|nr:hypothetical protein [Limisphaerales bacterium]MCS1413855.1 hypothetical protein [Limisphaerales bacterium]
MRRVLIATAHCLDSERFFLRKPWLSRLTNRESKQLFTIRVGSFSTILGGLLNQAVLTEMAIQEAGRDKAIDWDTAIAFFDELGNLYLPLPR